MLKILQTGDLHLGKIFHEHSLIDDQKEVLAQLKKELFETKDAYDALIITGDIYDRAIPPVEAIELFNDFLVQTHTKLPLLKICIICGNHDSAKRMSFGSSLFNMQNIFIATNPMDCTKPVLFEKEGVPVAALYQLPFLYHGDFTNEQGEVLKNQQNLVQEAVKRIEIAHKDLQGNHKNILMLLNAHLNTIPQKDENGTVIENASFGTAEYVKPTTFSSFDYVALGHIHKPLKVSKNAIFSGSPLETSFKKERKNLPPLVKHFLKLTFSPDKNFSIEEIPINPLHPVLELEGTFEEFEEKRFLDLTPHGITQKELENSYIEFICTNAILLENPLARLQKTYPFLLSIRQAALQNKENNNNFEKRAELFKNKKENDSIDPKDLFSAFIRDIYGNEDMETWDEEKKLFVHIAQRIKHETNTSQS